MRNEDEKKSIVKSVKLSPLQLEKITEKAQAKGMNFSEYMVDCALHGQQGITPLIAVRMQEIINTVNEVVDNIDMGDYLRKEELRQKTDAFCEIGKALSPQEKYDNLMNDVGSLNEGGLFIWESLK